MKVFELAEGTSPLIISIPHSGTFIPDEIKSQMTPDALKTPDTDWYIDKLYDFARTLNATIIRANYSRYVIDLNRPPDDSTLYPGQLKVGLCPGEMFRGGPIYKNMPEPDQDEINHRRTLYWQPYHNEISTQLQRVKSQHGYAILYDAHSIPSVLPRLFDGQLPDLNLGTNKGKSCAPAMEAAAMKSAQGGNFTSILNGRFIGGYITRHYGAPDKNIHALQMELTQKNYMDEKTLQFDEVSASQLRPVLKNVIQSMLDWGGTEYAPARTTPTQGLKPNR